jgi:hypothetical protein
MKRRIEERAAALLRREGAAALPVRRLHGALLEEGGPTQATYGELGMTLRQRTDLFLVFEPVDPLGGASGWSPELRAEYEYALREAGIDTDARVALAERRPPWPVPSGLDEPATGAPVTRIESSLVMLWSSGRADAEIRTRIAEALCETEAIRRCLDGDETE